MMRYSYTIAYAPGKHVSAADCLSRSPLEYSEDYSIQTTDQSIEKIVTAQENDSICQAIWKFSAHTLDTWGSPSVDFGYSIWCLGISTDMEKMIQNKPISDMYRVSDQQDWATHF